LEAIAFFRIERAGSMISAGEVVERTRPLTLRLRQRLRTVRIALKMALALNASPAKLSPKCQ